MKGETCPKFDLSDLEGCLQIIRKQRNNVGSDTVLISIKHHLESMVKEKMALIDSKILLTENSRINLLNDLTRIAFFDLRSYIHPPLKKFLIEALKRGLF